MAGRIQGTCHNGCPKPAEHDLGICGTTSVTVHAKGCTGCGACAEHCKAGAIAAEETTVRLDENRCILCGGCALVCPAGTITLDKKGFRLFAGGKMGRFPRLGRVAIPRLDDVEKVIASITDLLETYRDACRRDETRHMDLLQLLNTVRISRFTSGGRFPPSAGTDRPLLRDRYAFPPGCSTGSHCGIR